MKLKIIFLLAVGMFAAVAVSAQKKEKKHPIDAQLEKCLEKDRSPARMVSCMDDARKAWDKELLKNYTALMGKLDDAGKQTLETSQGAWVKYRDSEFDFINKHQFRTQGSVVAANSRLSIVKQRAIELKQYAADSSALATEVVKSFELPAPVVPKGAVFVCPMHPEYTSKKPGKCPICQMDLYQKSTTTTNEEKKSNTTEYYVCPMHPEVTSLTPAVCPKCGMDLVLKKK